MVGFIGSGNMATALARGDTSVEQVRRAALIVEAWTDTAVRHGIPADKAATLVTETMAGTAALLAHTDTLTARRAVTSPGGSTARGLNALEQGGVRAALANAMDAVVEP